jgi:precorrin-3B C17-methyltransferase
MSGKLHLVSVGPGSTELIPPLAESALRQSEDIVGYELYLKWIAPWLAGKEIHTLPLTKERERALLAIELARSGREVSLVSSGDIGIYAMASLVLELMEETDTFELAIVPGISAANGCAALLGAPLAHDFATLSLSDLLCPWEWIERRARHLAQADMAVALYNVQSQARPDGIRRVLGILLESKPPKTWCGVVRNAWREGQQVRICTLGELPNQQFDMLTTIIVGNRFTRRKDRFLYAPRGYGGWDEAAREPDDSIEPAVWVFSGTSDGNLLAGLIAKAGHRVIVSTASDYGRELAEASCPGVHVRAGRMGVEARRRELARTQARAIVDATHPFASEISQQLIGLSRELSIPYLRYERASVTPGPGAIRCADMPAAAEKAIALGRRIFLATGTKDLARFLGADGAAEREWFARVTPDSASIERALAAGISRTQLCAMQGPFSRAFNEALWRDWQIDCVVTKDSGDAGGFTAKAEAAAALGIPLISVERPAIQYPVMLDDFSAVIQHLSQLTNPHTTTTP